MPTVEFLETGVGRCGAVEVPEGGALLDVCDQVLAPVPFSCRSATCGTCQVEVDAGAEFLLAPAEQEQELLELLDGPPNVRLACQAQIKPGPGLIQLRPVGA